MKSFIVMLLCVLVCACGNAYQQENGRMVYVTANEGQGVVKTVVHGADIASFRDLGGGYAMDKNRVYRGSQAIPGAHPASFVVLSLTHAKDDAHVYFGGTPIPHADPATFAEMDLNYGRDKNDVYIQNRPIRTCDPTSFHFLKDDLGASQWAIDKQCAYADGTRLPGAHPKSFRVLNYEYAVDDAQAYSSTFGVVRGADAATFKLPKSLCAVCAQDKYRCYNSGKPTSCNPEFFNK